MRGPAVRLGALIALLAVSGCDRGHDHGAPPHATDRAPRPQLASTISVPIDADARAVTAAIERAVPKRLWSITQHIDRCVAPRQVKLFGRHINVTPTLGCTIVGEAVRGRVRIHGEGADIVADVPIDATISARDVGGILKRETATGSALAHARVRLDLSPDWQPHGTVRLTYGWTKAPGIDFLGRRIAFTDQADQKLAPIVRQLERTLPRELAKLDVRSRVERLWRRGFTSVQLNADRPPVWLRITPQRLHYDHYVLSGSSLRLDLAMEALTETFIGGRPADPPPTPLPPLTHGAGQRGVRIFVPVIADYAQLEPVIARALAKRSQRLFAVPGLGPVAAHFEHVAAYGASDGRIAVGLTLTAWPANAPAEKTHGTIWLAARPVNAPGSAQVSFSDVAITGDTDRVAGNLLLSLGDSAGIAGTIGGALSQNFSNDVTGLLAKIRTALAGKRIDDFVVTARIDRVESGRVHAYGEGLYLPVRISGDAAINYRPRR